MVSAKSRPPSTCSIVSWTCLPPVIGLLGTGIVSTHPSLGDGAQEEEGRVLQQGHRGTCTGHAARPRWTRRPQVRLAQPPATWLRTPTSAHAQLVLRPDRESIRRLRHDPGEQTCSEGVQHPRGVGADRARCTPCLSWEVGRSWRRAVTPWTLGTRDLIAGHGVVV
jgi:hypothetical protein